MHNHPMTSPFAPQFEPFPGRVMRASLEEMQKADIGRKYARKDKRPLDPPPVVRLRCFQSIQVGAGREVEQEFRDLDEHFILGFICHVDLIRVPADGQIVPERRVETSLTSTRPSAKGQPVHHDAAMPTDRAAQYTRGPSVPAEPFDSSMAHSFPGTALPSGLRGLTLQEYGSGPVPFGVERLPEPWAMRPKVHFSSQVQLPAVSGILTPEEDGTCTNLLAGETFVPCSLVKNDGRWTAMFVFSDLAVRQEGRFFIRYRVFNICGAETNTVTPSVPVLAECYGGAFQIFSTKSFPGLPVSTDLTKRLSLSGIRVHSRHRERRSWKKAVQDHTEYPTDAARGNTADMLGPSRAWCRTPERKPYHRADVPMPRTASYSESGAGESSYTPPRYSGPGDSFSYPPPRYSGLFNSNANAESSRIALAEWQRREMRDDAARSQGGSSPADTDEYDSASTKSLW